MQQNYKQSIIIIIIMVRTKLEIVSRHGNKRQINARRDRALIVISQEKLFAKETSD